MYPITMQEMMTNDMVFSFNFAIKKETPRPKGNSVPVGWLKLLLDDYSPSVCFNWSAANISSGNKLRSR